MFCTKCGTRLNDSARFCVVCGKPTVANPNLPPEPGLGYQSTPPPFETTAAEPRRLRRIMQGKKIAGVCNGYAEYFAMDVTLMRLIWIGLLLVPPHIGLIGYIVSWIVLPKS